MASGVPFKAYPSVNVYVCYHHLAIYLYDDSNNQSEEIIHIFSQFINVSAILIDSHMRVIYNERNTARGESFGRKEMA